jgi:hypothetical protein
VERRTVDNSVGTPAVSRHGLQGDELRLIRALLRENPTALSCSCRSAKRRYRPMAHNGGHGSQCMKMSSIIGKVVLRTARRRSRMPPRDGSNASGFIDKGLPYRNSLALLAEESLVPSDVG